ncbi:MAG TPA: MFS transporter [Gaiellales bacterium]|nr:MFS transporter [Gaiellales bacterium]
MLSAAIGISALGDWLALLPLNLELRDMHGSGLAVAALFIAVWSPAAVLAAPAGQLVDRFERRRLLAAASLMQAAAAAGLAYAGTTSAILALAAVLGIFAAIASPAEFALVPGIVPEAGMRRANGWIETARYAGFMFGPLAGGAVVAAGGVKVALLIDAASFCAVAAAAFSLHARAGRPASPERGGRARDGIVHLVQDRVLRIVMVAAFASLLFMTASAAAEVFFAKDVMHLSDAGFGAWMSAWPIGMVLGALVVARRLRVDLAAGALVAIVLQGVGLALPTVWIAIGLAFAGFLAGGIAHGTKNVLIRTLIHERVPVHLHGRTYAAYNGLRNAAELVALALGGVLVATIGARGTLFIAGAVPALAGLICVAVYARARIAAGGRLMDAPEAPTRSG